MKQTPEQEAVGCLKGIGITVGVIIALSLITILFYAVFGDQESMNNILYGGEDDDGGEVYTIRFVLILALIATAIVGIIYWRNKKKN